MYAIEKYFWSIEPDVGFRKAIMQTALLFRMTPDAVENLIND